MSSNNRMCLKQIQETLKEPTKTQIIDFTIKSYDALKASNKADYSRTTIIDNITYTVYKHWGLLYLDYKITNKHNNNKIVTGSIRYALHNINKQKLKRKLTTITKGD